MKVALSGCSQSWKTERIMMRLATLALVTGFSRCAADVDVQVGGLFPLSGERCIEGIHASIGARMAMSVVNGDADAPSTTTYRTLDVFRRFGNLSSALGSSFRMNVRGVGYGEVEVDAATGASSALGTAYGLDTEGTKPTALFYTDKLLHAGVDAIIGPLSSDVSELVSLLAKYDSTPVVSYFAPMAKLTSAEAALDTFIRT